MKSNIKWLVNSVDLPFSCISFFFNVGMKNDSICGISHLIEHIVLEELKCQNSNLFNKALINAYVDKEFTCFHAILLHENMEEIINAFNNLFDFLDKGLSNEIVESQKNIIYKIENERILSNPRLLNVLALEEMALGDELKKTTLVDETFLSISEDEITDFCKEMYLSSLKYVVISGHFSDDNTEGFFYNKHQSLLLKQHEYKKGNRSRSIPISLNKINDINDIRKIIAITVDNLENITDYYALHIICLLYKVVINNLLKDTDFFIKDITFKLYLEKPIIFIAYNNFFDKTMSILKKIEVDRYNELFNNIKKHFLYGYLQKSCNLLDFNKEIYKVFYFYNEKLDFKNIVKFIDDVNFINIKKIHTKVVNGDYFFVPDGNMNEYI